MSNSLAVVLTLGPVTWLQAFHCTCEDLVKKGPKLSEYLGLSRTRQLNILLYTGSHGITATLEGKKNISRTIAGLYLMWRRLVWPVIGPVNYQTCLCRIKCHLIAVISQEIEMCKNPYRHRNRQRWGNFKCHKWVLKSLEVVLSVEKGRHAIRLMLGWTPWATRRKNMVVFLSSVCRYHYRTSARGTAEVL